MRPANAAPAAAADPFAQSPVSTAVPSPDGPEWSAPPPPPPPPPPPSPTPAGYDRSPISFDDEPAPTRPPAPSEAPDARADDRSLLLGGVVLLGLAAGSAGLAYYTHDNRRKAEASLKTTRQSNEALIAAGLQPEPTSDLEQKIALNRNLLIGFASGAAALLVTGGILLLIGNNRRSAQQRARSITWRPRLGGLEVTF